MTQSFHRHRDYIRREFIMFDTSYDDLIHDIQTITFLRPSKLVQLFSNHSSSSSTSFCHYRKKWSEKESI